MENEILDYYCVAYLDILGYKKLVSKTKSIADIKKIHNVFHKTLGILKIKADSQIQDSDGIERKVNKDVLKQISFRVVSDTVLVTMRLDKCDFTDSEIQKLSKEDRTMLYIRLFLEFVDIFNLHFVMDKEFGYFMRGGISIGEHYEYPLPSFSDFQNTFIFSKAFVDCHDLAENKAKYIRVIIGDELIRYVQNILHITDLSNFNDIIQYDKEGLRCLNLYNFLKNQEIAKNRIVLDGIKHNLDKRINENRTEPYILEKYKYFVEYHNQKLHEMIQNGKNQYSEFLISINEI